MEQSQYTTVVQPQSYEQDQQGAKSKVPIFVKIASWFILLESIGSFFAAFIVIFMQGFLIILGDTTRTFFLPITLFIIQGIGLIVVYFGISHMCRWALYTFTTTAVLSTSFFLYSFLTKANANLTLSASVAIEISVVMGIQAFVLVYLWSIFKKFK